MDIATLQSRINRGYGKAALRLGMASAWYRPIGTGPAIAQGNQLGTVLAAFDASPAFKFAAPNGYAKPVWYGLFDGSQTASGDYLVNASGTWFIGAQQSILPILAVSCNTVLNLARPAGNTGVGIQPYGGDIRTAEVPVLTQWPASLLQGMGGETGATGLPGDSRSARYVALLPVLPAGVEVQAADILTDGLGRRLKVSSVELTDLGWRLVVVQAET